MRRIAIINQKGGVGKTTITTNLGHALALNGYKVTVVDMDPQGQLPASFGFFRTPTKGIDQVLLGETDINDTFINARDLITLVPAGVRLHEIQDLSEGGSSRAKLLRSKISDITEDQDFVLYDCPPSLGLLSLNAIFAASEALLPVCGDYLSLNGLAKMINMLNKLNSFFIEPLDIRVCLSRYYQRRRLSKEVMNKLLKHFPGKLLPTTISEAAVVAECPGAGRTIFEYRRNSRSANEFYNLAQDMLKRSVM